MYRIIDLQGSMMSDEEDVFNTLGEMVERLAGFHDIDWVGESDDIDEKGLQDYLDNLYSDKLDQLLWLCGYGEREIESNDTQFVVCPKKQCVFETGKGCKGEIICGVCGNKTDISNYQILFSKD